MAKFANVTVITAAAKLNEAISSIASRGKRLDADIHRAGVSCLFHIREHGDVTLLARLIEALPKSGRRKAFNHWAESHAPIEIDDKGAKGVVVQLKKDRKPEDFKMEDAAGTPFWDFTQERAPVPVTLEAILKMVENKLTKAVEQGNATDAQASVLQDAVNDAMARIAANG